MGRLPLEGIRIADFTWVGAGPYTTKLLADHGAEVIKIESGVRPDVLRLSPPFRDGIPGINRSGYFADRNTSKMSFQLDMTNTKSVELVKRLLTSCDVISNSFTPGTLDKWGLSYEEVKKIKEDIIYLSMPMQGTTGPHRNFMGFGATMNALIGFNHLTGFPDREPVGTGTNYPDHVPNPCHSAFAIISALRYRNRTGKGQYVEVAQTESALSVLAMAVMDMANNGRMQTRTGNHVSYAAPHGAYPCKGDDRWCVIACTTEEEWLLLTQESGLEHLAHDERFNCLTNRVKHADELDECIANWTRHFTPEEVMQRLQQKGVPAGVVQSAKDLIEHDPHMKHRKHFVKLNHPEMGESIYSNTPFKLSKTPGQLRSPAPLLGQHTEYICKKIIGLSDDEYRTYVEAGVFK